ncbi:PLP-dependent aminotransferase family protein [Eubacterium oxidoreducens]|uniref:GntR family transcriptional regulator / MocR family aminotransferase n=1 Tax=Eubacterium oxidoreducens TaxID=1732 RepID=A0A1G6CDQ7_EUBOX|nr:PLP-dependent aminotransferase family protein [Eubacterium oxidoreducens]SDB31038.1 GntR family transcriptional regulator / MocR family aminotransferase [Eubacterium oxidoreducens]
MITYDLEKRGKEALYVYLYRSIREDVLNGTIHPHEKLPSKRALAEHLGVSVITVENAYAQLVTEGYIYSKKAKGFFANKVEAELKDEAKDSEYLEEKKRWEEMEEKEHEFLIDFKANKSSLTHFPTSIWAKKVREVLSLQDEELLKTVPYNGLFVLRKAIAEYLYSFRGVEVYPNQIIIGAGTEYLYGRLMQLFDSNTIMAIEDPGYKKFSEISKSCGISWRYIPIDDQGMRVDKLKESGANVVHSSPGNHFPTGIVMPVARRQELLKWAGEKEEHYIIEDDYDCELRYTGKMIPTLFAKDDTDSVIYMNTFSKSLVPSIRISYMVLPKKLMRRYQDSLSFYSCTVSSFEQMALAKFISEGYFERHINRMKNYYKAQRHEILKAFGASDIMKIATIQEQNAGTHFLLKMDTTLTDEQIRQRAIKEDMYLALLSDYCTIPQKKWKKTIVINYAGIEKEKIHLAVELLEKIFKTDLIKK